jgi:protein involved in temperature-dependent protein secretion
VHLGRESVWEPDEVYGEIPYGAKMMIVDGVDIPLLDIRSLAWSAPEKESQDASA